MSMSRQRRLSRRGWPILLFAVMLLGGCAAPAVSPAPAGNESLRVVATTNILGDVVQNVGGEQIDLTVLLPVGADPHSYSATPADLRALSEAQIIFVVGEGIEESMANVLENRDGNATLVAVNEGIELLPMTGADNAGADAGQAAADEHHHGLDPHTWTAVPHAIHWVKVIEQALAAADPGHADRYAASAQSYTATLNKLDAEIQQAVAAIPAERRKLVTDHEVFGYFAQRYGFTVVGTVIPSVSTLASPSAQELAALQAQIKRENVPAIFVGTTVNPDLAQQVANDVGVALVPLYSDSLSAAAGPAATYVAFMRYDTNAIVAALR